MTYKEAREYLIPIAANCVLPQYAAALEKAMEALEKVESVVRRKDCIHYLPMDGTIDLGLCYAGYTGAKADGFCCYGERRADNG